MKFSDIEPENTPSSDKVIDQYLSDYKDTPMTVHKAEPEPERKEEIKQPPLEEMELSGEVLTGALFLSLIESIMPLIIGVLNDKFDNKKVDVKKMRLTAGQRKELAPICDEVVKHLNIKANPIVLLVTSLIGIYGLNYMALRNE